VRTRRVAERARRELRKSPLIWGRRVSCDCRHGVLLLQGRLPSYYQKQLAQEAVKRIDGVWEIINEIEVTG
jgi:osmotically-inducible protein OsmY